MIKGDQKPLNHKLPCIIYNMIQGKSACRHMHAMLKNKWHQDNCQKTTSAIDIFKKPLKPTGSLIGCGLIMHN